METTFDKNAQKFANLMISKIESISTDWKKPWFSRKLTSSTFLPQNITGRTYASGNAFLLLLLTEQKNFQTPVFLTFKQANEMNVSILKGSESFPVYYNMICAFHRETGEKISIEEYKELTEEEKKDYKIVANTKYYLVFNLDQTNYAEKFPSKWERFGNSFHKILMNKRTFDRAVLFGIHDLKFNDYGWLECGKLYDLRKIEFAAEKETCRSNYIEIGHGKNNTWAYGISFVTGSAGGGYCCDIWSDLYHSEEEAIQAGLNDLLKRHNQAKESMYRIDTCGNYKHEYSQKIVKQIERALKGFKQPVQLELFF